MSAAYLLPTPPSAHAHPPKPNLHRPTSASDLRRGRPGCLCPSACRPLPLLPTKVSRARAHTHSLPLSLSLPAANLTPGHETLHCHESTFVDGRCYLKNSSTSPTRPAKGVTLCVQPHEPPRPPAPPGPPGPSPERECWAGLTKACEKDRASPTECAACAAKEGPSVKCTPAEEQAFCRHPAPPAPPTPRPPPSPPNPADECFKGLEKVCESDRHDPVACAACAKKEGALVHCTPALEASFCSPHRRRM